MTQLYPSLQAHTNTVQMEGKLKEKSLRALLADLKRAEERSNREGWIEDDEMQRIMGLDE